MIGNANCVLGKGGVVIAVGIRGGRTEVLHIVLRVGVGVGTKGRERKSGFLRLESEGIHFDLVEEVFAALLAGEEIVNPGDEGVAAEFEGVAAGIEAESFGKLGAVFASGAGEQVRAANAVDNVGNLDKRVTGVGIGLAKIPRELGAEMADEPRGQAGSERGGTGFGGDGFFAGVGDGVVGDGAGGIEKDVVRSPVAGGVEAQGELVARSEIDIELGVRGIADLRGGKGTGKRGEVSGSGEDKGLIAGFIIAGRLGSGAGLGLDDHGAVKEFDDIGDVEIVLIESAEEEDFVFLDRTAERGSALLLAAVRLEGHHGIGRAEAAVADVVEAGAVPVVGAGFGDNVDDGAAGASLFRAVGVRGDAEFLDDFVGELVRRTVKAASLGEEGVVEVAAIDEETVLKSAQATERKITVGGGGEAARILRDAG